MLGPTIFLAPSTAARATKNEGLITAADLLTGATFTLATIGTAYGAYQLYKTPVPIGAAIPAAGAGGAISGAGATAAVGGAGIAGAVLPQVVKSGTQLGTTALILDYMKNNPIVVLGIAGIAAYFLLGRKK